MKNFALLGHNLSYSLSPKIHLAIHSYLGIKAKYEIFSVSPLELESSTEKLRRLDGFNITQPHKNSFTAYLSKNFSPVGAVNTVKIEDGGFIGYNTDVLGLKLHLENIGIDLKNKDALILGAGGMAAAAAYVLSSEGMRVSIYNRTYEKAAELAKNFNARAALNFENLKPHLIINCNSAALKDKDFFISGIDYSRLLLGYETIYMPTKFLESVEKCGATLTDGLPLLILQAIKANEIFLNRTFSKGETDGIYKHVQMLLKQPKNLSSK